MAEIRDLSIGTRANYVYQDGKKQIGTIVGRKFGDIIEGDIDISHLNSHKTENFIKIKFDNLGVPPETISISGNPNNIELL